MGNLVIITFVYRETCLAVAGMLAMSVLAFSPWLSACCHERSCCPGALPSSEEPRKPFSPGRGLLLPDGGEWAWFYPVRVLAQGKERTGVLSRLFLKERNSFCLSQVPELPADKGTVILCRSPGRLWQVGPALPGTPARGAVHR